MSGPVRFDVTAMASSGLLCRLIGLFAQLDLPAPALIVRLDGDRMLVEASVAGSRDGREIIVARRAIGLIGVDAVALDGAAV